MPCTACRSLTRVGLCCLLYGGVRVDVKISGKAMDILVKDQPQDPLVLQFVGQRKRKGTGATASEFAIKKLGPHQFVA